MGVLEMWRSAISAISANPTPRHDEYARVAPIALIALAGAARPGPGLRLWQCSAGGGTPALCGAVARAATLRRGGWL
jgi:hypothetical protein